jgi:GT2 family glycosyltransferase
LIAFGASITMPEVYERCARTGIARAAEPDSPVFAHAAAGSVARSYNLILDQAARLDGLEALVLLHQDAEITDPGFCAKVRDALSDPDVGVVGALGTVGADTIAWWEGSVTWSSFVYRYGELGGGEFPAPSYNGTAPPAPKAPGEVDSLYGFVLVLSPWAVHNLRFDESLGLQHGYDYDFCRQVRAAGRRVVTADLQLAHHHSLDIIADPAAWSAAHIRAAEKWDEQDGDDADWRRRARQAEADAAGARLLAASWLLLAYATAQDHENQLAAVTATRSWRMTEPLRRLNARLAARRGG